LRMMLLLVALSHGYRYTHVHDHVYSIYTEWRGNPHTISISICLVSALGQVRPVCPERDPSTRPGQRLPALQGKGQQIQHLVAFASVKLIEVQG